MEKKIKKTQKNTVEKDLKELPSIIFLTCNGSDLEVNNKSLQSILDNTTVPFEFVHIDNGSEQWEFDKFMPIIEKIIKMKKCVGIKQYGFPFNLGFIIGMNTGMQLATGKYFILFSNDVFVPKGWLKALIRKAESDEKIGIVCPKNAWRPSYLWVKNKKQMENGFMASLICSLIKRKLTEKIGMLDYRFGMGIMEDDDYSLRARLAGWKVARLNINFEHHHSGTWKKIYTKEERAWQSLKNKQLFNAKWVYVGLMRI